MHTWDGVRREAARVDKGGAHKRGRMGEHGDLTPLAVAALALLVERPMHPYEMYQLLLQRSEDRIVKVRPGSLYHTVSRLERHGYVRAKGTEREGNRPERTTYEVTEAGRLVLTERVSEMLATPENEYPEFPVAIAEAHNLPKDTVLELLRRRLRALRADAEYLASASVEVSKKNLAVKYWLDVRYLQAMNRAEIEWIDRLVADISSGDVGW